MARLVRPGRYRPSPAILIAGIALVAAHVHVLALGRSTGLGAEGLAMVSVGATTASWWVFRSRRAAHRPLVVWHHLAVVAAAAVATGLLARPGVWHTLDTVLPGALTMVAIGRVGCHVGGCCHGRPARIGVVYGADRLPWSAGPYVGVRLAPVQLGEAISCAVAAAIGSAIVVGGTTPGVATVTSVLLYAAVRVAAEAWRGDPSRGGLGTMNEAVVTSITAAAAMITVAVVRALTWTAAAGAAVVLASLALYGSVRGWRLSTDDHLDAARCELAAPGGDDVRPPPPSATWGAHDRRRLDSTRRLVRDRSPIRRYAP